MGEPWDGVIAQLSDEQLNERVRGAELGALNFGQTVEHLKVIRKVLEALSQEEPENVPNNVIAGAGERLGQITELLERMATFTVAQDQAQSQHGQIEGQANDLREFFLREVRPYLGGVAVDLAAKAAEANASLNRVQVAASEIDQILSQLRKKSGEVGAESMSSYYKSEAERHSKVALRFMQVGILVLVVGVLVGLWLFVWKPLPVTPATSSTTSWEEFTRALILRLLFIAVVSYLLAFAARNYRVNKHLEVANEERRNALDTYVLFAEALPNDDMRNLVTLELVRSLFAPAETGFISAMQEKTILENVPGLPGLITKPPGV